MELCGSNRDQRAGKWIRDRVVGAAGDLTTVIDADREAVVSTQRAEVDDLAVAPEHGFDFRRPGERIESSVRGEACNRSEDIDSLTATARTTGKRTEVGKAARTPAVAVLNVRIAIEERIGVGVIGIELGRVGAIGKQRPVFIQIIVEAEDDAVRPSERTDIDKSVTGLVMRIVILCIDPRRVTDVRASPVRCRLFELCGA